jgi:cytidylate kinase
MGKAVAEGVAERLGYQCLSRDVLLEASDKFNIPEITLQQAMTDAPSVLQRSAHAQQRYVAYILSALTHRLCQDNIVYHGLVRPEALKDISHVMKVRINADLELRVSIVQERDGLNKREARALINRLDKARRRFTRSIYGVDPANPQLYDLLLKIPTFSVEDAVDVICHAAGLKRFRTTDESRKEMQDLALASRVKSALVGRRPLVSVASHYGNVVIYYHGSQRNVRKLKGSVGEICAGIPGINNIEVHAGVDPPPNAV